MVNRKASTNNSGKVFRPKKQINRKTKVNLVFNADARREFLTGFHKRKLQRKKKAQDDIKEQLKIERKRIKDEARNLHKSLVVSHRPIPELEDILAEEETYEFEEHSVSVREISTKEMADENCWIGENKTQYEERAPEEESGEGTSVLAGVPAKKLRTGKDVKKAVKKLATRSVKKSKIFKQKGKMEQIKNRKKSRAKKLKLNSKRNKHNHPNNKSNRGDK